MEHDGGKVMEEESRFTSVIFGEGRFIPIFEERIVPFSSLQGLEYKRESVCKAIDDSYEKAFKSTSLPSDIHFNNVMNLYLIYRLIGGSNNCNSKEKNNLSLFIRSINSYLGKVALKTLYEHLGVPQQRNIAVQTCPRENTVLRFSPVLKDDYMHHKAVVIIRFYRAVDEILHYSIDGVNRIYDKMISERSYDTSRLFSISDAVKNELKSEITALENRLEKINNEVKIMSSKLKIMHKQISLSFIDKFILEVKDYLSDDIPDEPLTKRILSDALSDEVWEADFPGFLTKNDLAKILSDESLLRYGDYYLYLNEIRPIIELKDIVYK